MVSNNSFQKTKNVCVSAARVCECCGVCVCVKRFADVYPPKPRTEPGTCEALTEYPLDE